MTKDNLRKRQIIKPEECLFCSDKESVQHLMFECIVAKNIWAIISETFAVNIGTSFESVARYWVSNSKNSALNSVCAAVMWNLWKFRNDLVFNGVLWINIKQVWRRILSSVQSWRLLAREQFPQLDSFCQAINKLLLSPLPLENG